MCKKKSPYSAQIQGNTDQEKAPYLDTFDAVVKHPQWNFSKNN